MKKIRMHILIAILFLLIGLVISKFYYAKQYVLIERQSAENLQNIGTQKTDTIEIDKEAFGQFTTLFEAYKELSEDHINQVDSKELIDGAISGMTKATGDVYTSYTPFLGGKESTAQHLSSTYFGIGAEITMIDGTPVITNPFKNAPAHKAGIIPFDRILKVNGNDIDGKNLNEIVSEIKGEKGSEVVLTIGRSNMKPFDVTITRDEITINTVTAEVMEQNGKNIGYIEISSFSDETSEVFKEELKKLEKEQITGLIVDVRDNSGGYLEAVQKIASQLLPSGDVVLQTEDKNGKRKNVEVTSMNKKKKEYPIVLLMNEMSASASEILAGTLKESGGYPLIGETTYGKGTVQELRYLEDNSELKITVAKWLTPKGNWIHEKGVEPDVEVKQPNVFFIPSIQVNEEEVETVGDVSNEILYMQEILKLLGYEITDANGYFSEETELALKEFQVHKELEETGMLDEETVFALNQTLLEVRDDRQYDEQLKKALQVVAEE